MKRLLKRIINACLSATFVVVKDEGKRARLLSRVSQLLFDKNNSLEYDAGLKVFWLKHRENYLFAVKKPYYNFSKKNLYRSIDAIYCKNYQPKKGDVILDIGAGIGTETLYFFEKTGGAGKIYSIEASTDSYNRLNALCIKNNIATARNFNIAISGFNGKIWMEETEHFEVNRINTQQMGIEVDCFTLDRFIKDNAISKVDFLKVNIEGAELTMIEGMKEAIQMIDQVAISCHDFLFKKDKHILNSVVSFLEQHQFEIFYNASGDQVTDSWIYGRRR